MSSNSWATSPAMEKQDLTTLPLSCNNHTRLVLSHSVSAGVNPLGAEYLTRAGYRLRLGQGEKALEWKRFLSLGGQVRLSTNYAAGGPLVEWQPLAAFNLRAVVEGVGVFGTFGQLQSYRSPLDEYSDALRKANAASAYATTGWHALLQPTLQARVGRVAVQSVTSLDYRELSLRDGDSVWYEAGPDSLVPARGWTLTENITLSYLAGPLRLGTALRYFLPLYAPEHLRAGEQASVGLNSNLRLGLLATYDLPEDGGSLIHKPRVSLRAQWYLIHRYRTGAEVSQAMPSVGLSFSFQQDFVL
ncbi:hypothetical protein F0U60_14290 [Archangium minus]|uniref:Uncharacterized protein n=1 Tax=Archangium minus TaxID=83450 RepID=A0ABY9WQY5_9BACT|nr:hypothetical protein F0U60_14290 [Archangium minus]